MSQQKLLYINVSSKLILHKLKKLKCPLLEEWIKKKKEDGILPYWNMTQS